jgi:Cys-tRNA(Pro)/Cys-tRNA(Cys) deacylase
VNEEAPGVGDPRLKDVSHRVVTHEPAESLEEAARLRGVEPADVIKTMLVRRSESDYVFVLVPGNRLIDWPKLRSHLGERRLSLPDADEAIEATGYVPGTITPLGAKTDWPVVADERVHERDVSIGAGKRGWSITIDGSRLLDLLDAEAADVTRPGS